MVPSNNIIITFADFPATFVESMTVESNHAPSPTKRFYRGVEAINMAMPQAIIGGLATDLMSLLLTEIDSGGC